MSALVFRRVVFIYLLFFCAITTIVFIIFFTVEVSFYISDGIYLTKRTANSGCEEIHLVFVVGGANHTRLFATALKSILAHTQNPLRLYIFTDEETEETLETLMNTWNIPTASFCIFLLENHFKSVDWIPNYHYSGKFGLSKLLLPTILPSNVEKAIFLDTDVLVLSDILELWNEFDRMHSENSFGLVENHSEWYLSENSHHWPAVGKGYNSGVILLHLSRIRNLDWNSLWRETAVAMLRTNGATYLADQDILNAIFWSSPNLLYVLLCKFNYQLGGLSGSRTSCKDNIFPKIVHINNQQKKIISDNNNNNFEAIRDKLTNIDEAAFTVSRSKCANKKMVSTAAVTIPDDCARFKQASKQIYRTHMFMRTFRMEANSQVTLVTQMSADRFHMLSSLLHSWPHHISVSVYGDEQEINDILVQLSHQFLGRSNIAVHGVYKTGTFYPINYLRNVALDAVKTEFLLVTDIDFTFGGEFNPSSLNLPPHTVYVIPAFEKTTLDYQDEKSISEKQDLLRRWKAHGVQMFRGDIWPQAHAPTNYSVWRNSIVPYKVEWRPNFEPYIIGRTREICHFDSRFVGFGWNKVSQAMLLHRQGFSFLVHPTVFLVHQPHSPSNEIVKYRTSSLYRKCMKELKTEFIRDLLRTNSN